MPASEEVTVSIYDFVKRTISVVRLTVSARQPASIHAWA